MSVKRRRKFKRPVISRLTLAWAGAASVCLMIAGAALYPTFTGTAADRISLSVEGVETMARADSNNSLNTIPSAGGLRLAAPGAPDLAAPGLREEPAGPIITTLNRADDEAGTLTADILDYPVEFDPAEDGLIDPGEVVITIAGGDLRVTPVSAASITPIRQAVPDPDPALLRASPFGKIPTVSKDGRRALHFYRNAYEGANGRPQVALIVGGLGLDKPLTERAIDDLPAEVSLGFAPYAKDLEFWTSKARAAGHEVLIELPMESYGGDPAALGTAGLLSSRTPEENLQRLDWLLSRFGGYFAATNYLGGKFSADSNALTPVLSRLREAGVGYIDDTGAAGALASRTGTIISSVSTIIPPAPDDSARRNIRRELKSLATLARKDGTALGKTYAYAVTIDEIVDWAEQLEDEGLSLAPASVTLPSRYATR